MCIIIDNDNELVNYLTSEVFKYVYTSKINKHIKIEQPNLVYSLKHHTLEKAIKLIENYASALILVKVLFGSGTLIYFLKLNNKYFIISYLIANNNIKSIHQTNEYNF